MAIYTIMRIYEIPADNVYQATDRMMEALELHVEKDYLVKDILRKPDEKQWRPVKLTPAINWWRFFIQLIKQVQQVAQVLQQRMQQRNQQRKEVRKVAKFIARVFVPKYLELEARDEEEAKQKAEAWYKEQKRDWKEPTVEVTPVS